MEKKLVYTAFASLHSKCSNLNLMTFVRKSTLYFYFCAFKYTVFPF